VTYPLCTIANTPRLPEHCIEFVKIIQWPKENPFQCEIDGDDPAHLCWIHEKSLERASHFGTDSIFFKFLVKLCDVAVFNAIKITPLTNLFQASLALITNWFKA
jgi:NEDD8-activating enzyme E1